MKNKVTSSHLLILKPKLFSDIVVTEKRHMASFLNHPFINATQTVSKTNSDVQDELTKLNTNKSAGLDPKAAACINAYCWL